MSNWFSSCFDELTKIAVRLTSEEKRRQAVQFAALGTTTVPAMELAKTRLQTGRWLPAGVKGFRRYIPGALAGGLFWGGALPTAQHFLARGNIQKARERVAAKKELKSLAPAGVAKSLAVAPKAPIPRV